MRKPVNFWDRVDMSGGPDACWPFLGSIGRHGYGNVRVKGVHHSAHRHAFNLAVGPAIDGLDICHRCNNRSCVNPKHLYQGTRKDNMADVKAAGTLYIAPRKVGPEGTAWCRVHQDFLPVANFSKNKARWNNLDEDCRSCKAKRHMDRKARLGAASIHAPSAMSAAAI